MRYLLDTNIIVRWFGQPEALPFGIESMVDVNAHDVMMSIVNPWEIAIKYAKGKLPDGPRYLRVIQVLKLPILAVTLNHVQALTQLPPIHNDPFDRMLAAQSIIEGAALVTDDAAMRLFRIKCLW